MKEIIIPASKSISNRLLVLQYLYPDLELENLSTAKDTQVLQQALNQLKKEEKNLYKINIGHAGTAMRFLTALFSIQENKEFILDGSDRMRQRPIHILVEALKDLGADITYLKKEGYPPLYIKGRKLKSTPISLKGSVSSQYITALMLIASSLPNGLKIRLQGEIVSRPYIEMSLNLLKKIGVEAAFSGNKLLINPLEQIENTFFNIEGDWSSASYFYGRTAITKEPVIISKYFLSSLQGDSKIKDYFIKLGVETRFMDSGKILLSSLKDFVSPSFLEFNLLETPDLAQTLAVTCFAMGINCRLTGLQTLKIKETDRLQALYNELSKFGADIKLTQDSLELKNPSKILMPQSGVATYEDHRMAMAFAILQKKYDFEIKNPEVVVKSFPDFWEKF